ncbi:uncharacterized protein, partial [Pempheris klunzingeri]|uniref:uncharacterized protein n=1 Tax=Pempheris klunzingeri TaxID=3127111 RepID=UPI00397FCA1A
SLDYENQVFQHGSLKTGINFDKYDDIPVNIEGKQVEIKPQLEMSDCNMSDVFRENLSIAGYTKLTPIQKYAFPCLIDRHDLLGCAQTGSGKTVAFVLPLLHHIYNEGYYHPKSAYSSRVAVCMPKALIMAPTRELATQIYEVAVKFAYRTMIEPAVVFGGVSIKTQYMSLFRSGHMLVGTPGRIFDMYNRGFLSFENCRYVVLDEADRMLDMGFEPQINAILSGTDMPAKSERLNCMFSATFHDSVKRLVSNYMNTPYVMITVGQIGGTTDNITQSILSVPPHEKFGRLIDYLKTNEKVLVFTETKFNADRVEISLYEAGYKVVCIHGDRDQQERDMALSLFKSGKANIMVATGVASRGLDIPDVKRVILYDCPKNIDDYIHRIGRTGRAGNTGEAITFYSSLETSISRDLVNLLQKAKQDVPDFLRND